MRRVGLPLPPLACVLLSIVMGLCPWYAASVSPHDFVAGDTTYVSRGRPAFLPQMPVTERSPFTTGGRACCLQRAPRVQSMGLRSLRRTVPYAGIIDFGKKVRDILRTRSARAEHLAYDPLSGNLTVYPTR